MWQHLWTRRDKTALYLIPPPEFHKQEFFAHLWPFATVIDWRAQFLETRVGPTQRYLNVSVDNELAHLRATGETARQLFCFINNEYFLAHWTPRERERFWFALWNDFPHLEGIIVFTVLAAPELLPDKIDLAQWRAHGRLFSPDDFLTEAQHDENQGLNLHKRASDIA